MVQVRPPVLVVTFIAVLIASCHSRSLAPMQAAARSGAPRCGVLPPSPVVGFDAAQAVAGARAERAAWLERSIREARETEARRRALAGRLEEARRRDPEGEATRKLEEELFTLETETGVGGAPRRTLEATGEAACTTADTTLATLEAEIVATPAPPPRASSSAARPASRAGAPARLDLVSERLLLSPEERRAVERRGFVVLDRLAQKSYTWAFHDLWRLELPLYVSVDALLQAVWIGHEQLLTALEDEALVPELGQVLGVLHCALPGAAPYLAAEAARDLDLYLVVARTLLEGAPVASALGDAAVARQAAQLVAQALAHEGMADAVVFGRHRTIDFSTFEVRGPYARERPGGQSLPRLSPAEEMAAREQRLTRRGQYFRAVMWLSRVPFELDQPREARAAVALAELAGHSGALAHVEAFAAVWRLLAGGSEGVALSQVTRVVEEGAAPPQRTVLTGYLAAEAGPAPPIASLIAPAVTADTSALALLVHGPYGIPSRHQLTAADIAYVLGHDRALRYLGEDLTAFPSLEGRLADARALLAAEAPRRHDLYHDWLAVILALGVPAAGAAPSFMRTEAFADLRLSSVLAGYAQLREVNVLPAAELYGQDACAIPDAFVEPAPEAFAALARYADAAAALSHALAHASGLEARFVRMGAVARALEAIARRELAGLPLTPAMQRYLAMIVEIHQEDGYGGVPTFTGWYFDLFEDVRADAFQYAELSASVYTSAARRTVLTLGAGRPALGIFVIDTAGPPRVAVGPVASAWAAVGGLDRRGPAERPASPAAPWAASHRLAAPPLPPAFHAELEERAGVAKITVTASADLGPATVEVYGEHRRSLAKVNRSLGPGETTLTLRLGARPHEVRVTARGTHAFGAVQRESDCNVDVPCASHALVEGGASEEKDD